MAILSKKIKVYVCERCEHKWSTKDDVMPAICPRCKTRYWNKPKIRAWERK